MAPKNRKASDQAGSATGAASSPHRSTSSTSSPATVSSSSLSKNSNDAQAIAQGIWQNYVDKTPQRTKLIDLFMVFLVAVGALQFVYCVLAGNFPFNAFLAGFAADVGQFVLTASLRMQTNPQNQKEFETISPERAFADYVFGSLLLHFFCINFIN